jgi:hypothetical protein
MTHLPRKKIDKAHTLFYLTLDNFFFTGGWSGCRRIEKSFGE